MLLLLILLALLRILHLPPYGAASPASPLYSIGPSPEAGIVDEFAA